MDEPALADVGRKRARMAVRETAADTEHDVGFQEDVVADRLADLDAAVAGVQRMVLRDAALGHIGGDDRDRKLFRKLHDLVGAVREHAAAAHDDDRLLRFLQHCRCRGDILGLRRGHFDRCRLVGIDVKLDLRLLDVQRKLDQHRARAAGTHQPERFLHDGRKLRGILDRPCLLGHGLCDLGHIHALEGLLLQLVPVRLADDREHRHRVDERGVKAGHEVGRAGAGGADRQRDLMLCAEVAVRRMHAGFLMTHREMLDRCMFQILVNGIDGSARDTESGRDPLFYHDLDKSFRKIHHSPPSILCIHPWIKNSRKTYCF